MYAEAPLSDITNMLIAALYEERRLSLFAEWLAFSPMMALKGKTLGFNEFQRGGVYQKTGGTDADIDRIRKHFDLEVT